MLGQGHAARTGLRVTMAQPAPAQLCPRQKPRWAALARTVLTSRQGEGGRADPSLCCPLVLPLCPSRSLPSISAHVRSPDKGAEFRCGAGRGGVGAPSVPGAAKGQNELEQITSSWADRGQISTLNSLQFSTNC